MRLTSHSFLLSLALFSAGCTSIDSNTPKTLSPLGGEGLTTPYSNHKAFSQRAFEMDHDTQDREALGRSFFTIPWVEAPSATTARDGLGPLFSANTCVHCHPNMGAGAPLNADGSMRRSLVLRLSHMDKIDPIYGTQLNVHGVFGVTPEGTPKVSYQTKTITYPDGKRVDLRVPSYHVEDLGYGEMAKETMLAPHIAQPLIGLGLLEAIKEADILANVDAQDKNHDGISGRANYPIDPSTHEKALGRFAWKADAVSVKAQSAGAFINDMGITTPLYPNETCTDAQEACLNSTRGEDAFDAPENILDAVAFFVQTRAVPAQRTPNGTNVLKGYEAFNEANCAACHTPTFTTGNHEIAAFSNKTIHPFTDLLLHDMGEDLSDHRPSYDATGREWRTAPLWGVGLRATISGEAFYLHDGRARTLEEAILWHGGEALSAKERFMSFPQEKREHLLAFLRSL